MPVNEIQRLIIACGQGGLNYSQAIDEYPVTDLRRARNLTFEDGTWQKEPGAEKINTTAITSTPKIVGLHDFWIDSSTQRMVAATSDGKYITFTVNGLNETLKSGLGSDKQCFMVEASDSNTKKLFFFNGYDVVQVLSGAGATTSNISSPPADWTGNSQPQVACFHNGRLWGFLGHRAYYSVLNNPEDLTSTGSGNIWIYPGEGEKIAGCVSIWGRLFVFKYPRGIYWIDDSILDHSGWECHRLTDKVGIAGHGSICLAEGDVIFLSTDGLFHSLAAVQEIGEARSSAIFPDKIGKFLRDHLLLTRLNRVASCYYGNKKEIHFGCTQKTFSVNNIRLIVDISYPELGPRYRWSDRDICESMTLIRDSNGLNRPAIGDNAGFIWHLDTANRNKGGSAYSAEFETAEVEAWPGRGQRRANLHYIEAVFRPEGNHNLDVQVYRDGYYSQTVSLNMSAQTGGALDSFTLGTDVLGGGNVLNVRKRIVGDARRISAICSNSGLNQNFSIASLIFGVTPGNQRF